MLKNYLLDLQMELIPDTWVMHLHDEALRQQWLQKLGKSGKHFADYAQASIFVSTGILYVTPNSTSKKWMADEIPNWKLQECKVSAWEENYDYQWNTYFSILGQYKFGEYIGNSEVTFMQQGCANERSFMSKKNKNYERTCNLLGLSVSRNLPEMKQDMFGNRKPHKSLINKLMS
jgi:hypothetical protein